MRFIFYAVIAVFCSLSSVYAATITPAFGKFSSAGGSVDAAKQNINTMQVVGATFSKPGGNPTMTVPDAAMEISAAASGTPGDSSTFGFLDTVFKKLTWANIKSIIRGGVAYDTDYASLSSAVTAIGSTPRTLKITTNQTLTGNLTIPATLELLPLNGAVINHGTYTINYAGSTARWPLVQVFNGAGTVTFSGLVDKQYAVWTGGEGTTLSEDIAALDAKFSTKTALEKAFTESLPVGSLTPPADFNDQLNMTRRFDGQKVVYARDPYDAIDFTKVPGASINAYFVNYSTGLDTNDGLTSGTAWKTLTKAVTSAVSPATITVLDAWIGYQSLTTAVSTFTGDFKIIGGHASGKTLLTGMRESYVQATFAWADEGGGCWSTSTATTSSTIFAALGFACFDANYPDEFGGAMPLPDVGSAAACIATPGSQYHDAANSKKYVHLLDGRKPDPYDGWIYSSGNARTFQQGSDTGTLLMENIHAYINAGPATSAGFRYRHSNSTTANNSKYGVKNCLSYGAAGNGFETYDAKIVAFSGCKARYNRSDNFNYHSFVSTGTHGEYMTVYEYNCLGTDPGYQGFSGQAALGSSCNGSTSHDSMHVERVNSIQGGGNGATIADVNGVVSVNWNVLAGPSTGGSFKSCFWHDNYLAAGSNNGMYLWGCSGHDDGNSTVRLLNNEPQGGAVDGQIYLKYWRGQTDGTVTGTLKDFSGNDI